MSKINPTIPFTLPLTGNVGKYTPFPRRFQAGNAFLEVCRRIDPTQVAKTGQTCFRAFISSQWDCGRGRSRDVRDHAPPRWRLSMRRSQGDRFTISHSKLRPSRCRDKRGLSRYDPRGRSPFMALLYTFTTPAPYAITLSSCDIRLRPSLRAWVISIRSNGSL